MGALSWIDREPPLAPAAVWARGAPIRALLEKLLSWPADRLASMTGVQTKELIIVLGAEEDLPWVDGARYLGRDPLAPTLLLPTNLAPSVHAGLFERAIRRQTGEKQLLAVLADPEHIVPLGSALPLSAKELAKRLEAER